MQNYLINNFAKNTLLQNHMSMGGKGELPFLPLHRSNHYPRRIIL